MLKAVSETQTVVVSGQLMVRTASSTHQYPFHSYHATSQGLAFLHCVTRCFWVTRVAAVCALVPGKRAGSIQLE